MDDATTMNLVKCEYLGMGCQFGKTGRREGGANHFCEVVASSSGRELAIGAPKLLLEFTSREVVLVRLC